MIDECLAHPHKPIPEPMGDLAVCGWCRQRFHADLSEVAQLWPLLSELDALRGGAKRGPGSTPPTSVAVLALQDLASKDEPGGLPPAAVWIREMALATGAEDGQDTLTYTTHIRAHADELLALEEGGQYARGLRRVSAVLRRFTGEAPAVLDRCSVLDTEGQPCGGPLTQERDGSLVVRCGKCGDEWGKEEMTKSLARLGYLIGEKDG